MPGRCPRRSAGQLLALLNMPNDSTDQPWRLDTGNHPLLAPAAGTDLDVDRRHPFEALPLTHQCRGQWLLLSDKQNFPGFKIQRSLVLTLAARDILLLLVLITFYNFE